MTLAANRRPRWWSNQVVADEVTCTEVARFRKDDRILLRRGGVFLEYRVWAQRTDRDTLFVFR